jgi:hypothetical protein
MKQETVLAQVRRLFNSPYVSEELNRRNRLKWVASRRVLGDKWLLAHRSAA